MLRSVFKKHSSNLTNHKKMLNNDDFIFIKLEGLQPTNLEKEFSFQERPFFTRARDRYFRSFKLSILKPSQPFDAKCSR